MSPGSRPPWKEIGWNGLVFQCPQNWDAIVSGERHLLFEDNFTPVLELRWQEKNRNTKSATKAILQNLKKDNGLFPHKSIPESWQALANRFSIHPLLKKKEDSPCAALLTCKECGTTLLFYFFETLPAHHPALSTLFTTLCCHGDTNRQKLWAIQDFRLLLPGAYQLSSYSFGAGLTRLSFHEGSLVVHICRLAPASQRLQSSNLAELLMILGGVTIAKDDIQQTDAMASHSRHPPIHQQILDRLKRKLPFHEIQLRHHPECDRLTGLFLFDKKPISKNRASSILDSYEIFPS